MSTLTAFGYIQENSDDTPGLFNRIFSQLSDNIQGVDQSVATFGANLSGSTWASIGLTANSSNSDYVRLVDSSGQRSTYRIGSAAGGTADGLNIWDESGNTMIASFSKQSIRFYQNVVGPVFDTGGALTDTLNAATFGTGADSLESRIQSAIDAASNDGISRVYLPASMYPYSASSISFINTVQMVREGGTFDVFDLRAYGATGDGIANDTSALTSADLAVVESGGGFTFASIGTYRIRSSVTVNSTLKFDPGGLLQVDSGVTVLINNDINAGLAQIFSQSTIAGVFFAAATGAEVFPEWWGTSGGEINQALASVAGKFVPVKLASNTTYTYSSTLTLNLDGQSIIGPGLDNFNADPAQIKGAKLNYTGTGNAIVVGVSPDVNGTFIRGIRLEGFFLVVPEDCNVAVDTWMSLHGIYRDIGIFGNSTKNGGTRYSWRERGGVANEHKRISVRGDGTGDSNHFLTAGVRLENGYSNSPTTASRWFMYYGSSCLDGFSLGPDCTAHMYASVIENCALSAIILNSGSLYCFSLHAEGNIRTVSIVGDPAMLVMYGGSQSIGTQQVFIFGYSSATSSTQIILQGIVFGTSHATPQIVSVSGGRPSIQFGINRYPANYTLVEPQGTSGGTSGVNAVGFIDGSPVMGYLSSIKQTQGGGTTQITTREYLERTVLSASDVDGPLGQCLDFIVRDTANGGAAWVLYENAVAPLITVVPGGATVFVAGAPAAGQIQIKNRTGNGGVAFLANANRNNVVVFCQMRRAQ